MFTIFSLRQEYPLSIRKPLAAALAAATAAAASIVGIGAANAADVSLPQVEDNRVSVRVDNPIGPALIGQSCAGALVPPYALPAVIGDVLPLLDGNVMDIIGGIAGLNDNLTLLTLAGAILPSPVTVGGRAGTLVANNVRDDFYVVPVICFGGRNNAPMEINLFLTQVGNPLGAFEGSVTGSVGGSGSADCSSIGLGSAGLGVGSQDGMVDLGSTSGSGPGSTVGVGFDGSIADVTSGSVGVGTAVGSAGSDAGVDVVQGSLATDSVGELDTASLTSSLEWPAGSSQGSSIDVGSAIPVATSIAGSVGDLSLPGS